MAHHKINLPTKLCIVCQRSFTWRKKWQRDWENVKYCSKKCQSQRNCEPDTVNSVYEK